MLVAESNEGEVIGFVSAYRRRDKAYISALAVSERYRGLGVGAALLEAAENALKSLGTTVVSLSVKQENTRALDLYLRRGYEIKGVVLILGANVHGLCCCSAQAEYELSYKNPAYLRSRRLRNATWWSSLTEPVDRLVYKRDYRGVQALVAYKKRRVKGFVEFSINQAVDVENVGLASYTDPEVLKTLFCELARIALSRGIGEIRVYVDSSKSALVRLLENMGFRVDHAEYLLVKELE